jgi:hypothetical protein
MLNGNMVGGTSKRGVLVRVGREQQAAALARPGATPMEMTGRPMQGYVFVDPPPPDDGGLREWLGLGVCVRPHAALKRPKSRPRRNTAGQR